MLAEPQLAPPPPPVPPAWSPRATVGIAAAVFVAYLLVQAGVLLLFPAAGPGSAIFGLAFATATLASAPVGILLILSLAGRRPGPSLRATLGLFPPRLPQAAVAVGLLLLFTSAYDLLARLLHRPAVPAFMIDAYRTARFLPALYLAVVIAAPAFEELLFRGLLLDGLRRSRLGVVGAALLSSLAFALPHLQYDLYDVTAVFLLGLLFAAVRLRTGSTYLTIGLHALTNLIATLEVAAALR
ncbi:MAG TPA: type II CAAX endopeptidase family protein [Thermoanaerobaculia bacterium]|nr:type II CAAX endopeptidase family protein [Thermoanaerobaculia bacterium]